MTMAAKEDASSVMIDHAIAHLDKYRNRLMAVDGDLIIDAARELRGLEGISSKIYFDTINQTLPEQYRFKERSQHPAMDVANALLNYGYGLLYGKVESGWEKKDGKTVYTITIPANCTAEIVIKGGQAVTVKAGIFKFEE